MARFRIYTFCIIISFLVIWLRLFYWQIFSHERLKILADAQHFYQLELIPNRGEILSVDKTPLVTNQTAYLVFVEKKKLQDIENATKQIAPILEEDEASISAILNSNEVWIPIKHQVIDQKVTELKKLAIEGLGFEREDKRYYPEASMAAHLTGFVGKDEHGKPQGYFGLEGYYDEDLKGKNGFLRQERDALGNPIVIGQVERINPKNGRTLVLYLDKTIQHITEDRLKKGIERYGAKAGSVIVMDPKTGGIIASASYPSYFQGDYGIFPKEYYINPVVASSYEPGSTFKPLVIASSVNEGTITPDQIFDEKGPVQVGTYSIKTWNNEYHGSISVTQILEYSSNVGMVFIAKSMDRRKLFSYVTSFGFGEKTGVDLEDEDTPTVRSFDEWREIDFATVSFGQGIATTPLQMIRAVGVIANKGKLMEPHVVKEVIDNDGKIIEIVPVNTRQVISEKTASIITEMMVNSVTYGEAKWRVPKGVKIAGKTGTAQIPVEGHYDSEKTIASFIGFGPTDNPQFVMLVTLKEPTSSPWGSETAAPLFFQIATEIIRYYNVIPNN